MKTVKLIIDGKEIKAQVNEEDLKALENEKNFRRQSKNKPYFFFDGFLNLRSEFEELVDFNEYRYKTGNYFLTEKECEDAASIVSSLLLTSRKLRNPSTDPQEIFETVASFLDELYEYFQSCTKNKELWKRDYRLCLQRYLVRYIDEDSARALSLWYEVKQFADKNDKREDNFTKESEIKYYIYFNYGRNTPAIDWRLTCKEEVFQIYFNSKETAQEIITEFYDELMWYFTEYGKNTVVSKTKKV